MLVRDAVAMLAGSSLEALGPMTWADLGCGDGILTVALADLLAPCSLIHAIDRSRAALKQIPSHRHDVRIHTHLGDFIEPWRFGAVDGIRDGQFAPLRGVSRSVRALLRIADDVAASSPHRRVRHEQTECMGAVASESLQARGVVQRLFIPVAGVPAIEIAPRAALRRADGGSVLLTILADDPRLPV